MSHRAVIPFATPHFESDRLGSANVLYHISHDRSLVNYRRADRKLSFIRDEEHAIQRDFLAFLRVQKFHLDRVARRDAILFTACFNDCVHKVSPKGTEIASKRDAS